MQWDCGRVARRAPIDAERAVGQRDAARERRELVRERGEHAGRLRLLLVLHRGLYAAAVLRGPRALEQPAAAAAAAGERPERRAHRAHRQTREVALDALPPALAAARLHGAQVLQCDTDTGSRHRHETSKSHSQRK